MDTARISSKGQVTVPKRVRTKLAVGPGDQLAFEFDEGGLLRVTPVHTAVPPLRGLLADAAGGRHLDSDQIDEAIRQRMHAGWLAGEIGKEDWDKYNAAS